MAKDKIFNTLCAVIYLNVYYCLLEIGKGKFCFFGISFISGSILSFFKVPNQCVVSSLSLLIDQPLDWPLPVVLNLLK